MDLNENKRNSYKNYLEGLEISQQKATLELNMELIREAVKSSDSYLKLISERINSVIFMVLGVIFGAIINFFVAQEYITLLIWYSFIFIYLYLIITYIILKLYVKNYKITILIGGEYLYKMSIKNIENEFVNGSLILFDCMTAFKNKKYSEKYLNYLIKLRNSCLYLGVSCFILQLIIVFFGGYEDWPRLTVEKYHFSDFIESTLEFFKN